MKLDGFQNFVQSLNVHIGGIDEFIKFKVLVPYFLFEDGLRSDGEAITTDKIGFAFVTEIWIILQKRLKPVLSRLKFAVLVFEHADGASCVYYQDLFGK